ncbi:MAG: glycogen debranching protein GlgX [Pseudomonadota bacterium]
MLHELSHRTNKNVTPGKYYPLGAVPREGGVNFAIYSKHAKEVFLLLFDAPDGAPTDMIRLEHRTRYIWHAFVAGISTGQLYGYKIRGDYNPAQGLRFNEYKLMLDPYAKALTAKCRNIDNLLIAYDALADGKDLIMDRRDNSQIMPKAIIINDSFDWQGDARPDIPFEKLIIYEAHLKGFTMHPSSGVKAPGTYLGFIEKIPYLKSLGINAVEFLPLQEFYFDDFLLAKGLTNYWGYNTIGFFSPELSYSSRRFPGCQVDEFKTLVRELHKAGIEVILDVVYNHTGEGTSLGPTVCFRGIDNPTYYCLEGPPDQPLRQYKDVTGCGNSMNLADPHVMRLVMDSLRYWVQEMHVDGFRFDLATALGREEGKFEKSSSFYDAISQDPVLNTIKIIAEPWDIETYQVGNFPVDWSEWNGKFRDTLRRFIRGDAGQLQDLGWRLTGSADLYGADGRHPYNSINFITCHDGFTLYDLASYTKKQNEENLESNKDGADENFSWNCGAEGATRNENILRLRKQHIKNFLCCLLFSRGTPMLLGGDEFMRTQKGNNNAYCQDNEISWINWDFSGAHADILEFCRKAIAFRSSYAILQEKKFFVGTEAEGNGLSDIVWFGPDLKAPAWEKPESRTICFMLDGREDKSGHQEYLLFFILHADAGLKPVQLPRIHKKKWHRIIDTSLPAGDDFVASDRETPLENDRVYQVKPGAIVVLLGK